jgi:hypothetical protein
VTPTDWADRRRPYPGTLRREFSERFVTKS